MARVDVYKQWRHVRRGKLRPPSQIPHGCGSRRVRRLRRDTTPMCTRQRETPYFSDRERAALAMAEAMTTLDHEKLDVAVEGAKEHFDGAELAKLTCAVVAINSWNRLAITAAGKVGGYVAGSL